MAQIGELLIALQGDSKSWSNALKVAGKGLEDLTKQAQKAGTDLSKFNAKTINLLKGWENEVGSAYKSFDEALKPVKQGLVDQGMALKVNQKGINTLALETVTASQKLRNLSESLKGVSSSLWLMSTGLQQFGRSMVTNFTVPLTAAAGLSTKIFMDWEKGTLAIQRAAEITKRQAEIITNSFITISQQVPITVEELQKAGYAAAQAGVTGEEAITNFAEAAVKLSKVGGDAFRDLPIEKLANDLAKLSIAFGVSGENMEEVNNTASMLLAVSKAVPGGLAEVIEAMRRVAGAATTYGVSIETTTALTGTLVAAAVPAARAGTELSRVFHSMVGNIDLVGEAMGYTGEDLDKLKERMETDMGDVLIELIGRLGQTDDMWVKNQISTEIFGEVGKKALLPLINNYPLLLDLQLRANQELESGALLAAEFDIQANSLSGTMSVFTNNLKALGSVIGKDLAPYISYFLKTFTSGVRNLIEGWQRLNPAIKFAVFLVGSLLAVIGPLALLFNTLFIAPISGITTFITFLTKANLSIGLTSTLTKAGTAGILSFGGAFSAVIPSIVGFTKTLGVLAFGLAKILLVVGLIAGAVYLLGKAFGIGFKFPTMPEIKLPTYGKAKTPKAEGAEAEKLEAATEADEKAAKKKEKELTKELRDKRKARDKELGIIEKNINEYEKIKKTETKISQKLVDEQKDALDIKREQWEDEKRLEDEKIRMQQDTLDNIRKTLKASKKALNEIKDVYDDELDIAENGVDFAEMNLDAAQDALKREVLLGRDEYDASYNAAVARVKAMEEAVQLARENVIKVKREYQKQINAQEKIVDATQEQVDLQTDALNDLKDALADRKAIVDKEIDLMDDELKIRQKSLDNIRKNTQEKLDILREERDTIKEAHNEEIDIIQDQLDAARDYADEISGMGLPELPDLAGHLGGLDEEIQSQMDDMQTRMKKAFEFGFVKEEGWLEKLLEDYKISWDWAKEEAKKSGKSATGIFIKAMLLSFIEKEQSVAEKVTDWLGKIWLGEEMWSYLKKESEEKGTSMASIWLEGWKEFFSGVPEKIRQTIQEKVIDPIKSMFPGLFKTGEESGEEVEKGLTAGTEDTEQEGTNAIQNFIKGLGNTVGLDAAVQNVGSDVSKLGEIAEKARGWGSNIVDSFREGMESAKGWLETTVNSISNLISRYWESWSPPKEGPLKNIDKWGANLTKTYADSIAKGIPYIENALGNISGGMASSFAGGASASIPSTRAVSPAPSPAGTVINRNYYIQPGQMIASRGEIRNFVRMLKEYNDVEGER